jgi:hypothetical protein
VIVAHPSNEPGKTYDVDDRRRLAALAACDGIPTEQLERGIVKELYAAPAFLALADKLGKREGLSLIFPVKWWDDCVRGMLDALNNIAAPERIQ